MELKNFKFKYFNGEEKNPFLDKDENAALWWEGEKSFHSAISGLNGDSFIQKLRASYDEAFSRGDVSGLLADESVPKETRMLVFYLDLWHGKWYPYESLDEILKY